jgi:hypothetical protein
MNEETKAYLGRTITRLDEILAGHPFQVRAKLIEFVGKLKEVHGAGLGGTAVIPTCTVDPPHKEGA